MTKIRFVSPTATCTVFLTKDVESQTTRFPTKRKSDFVRNETDDSQESFPLTEIATLTCNQNTIYLATETGALLCCKIPIDKKQICHHTKSQPLKPIFQPFLAFPTELLKKNRIRHLACGLDHVLAGTDNKLFSWGSNHKWQLGHSHHEKTVDIPAEINLGIEDYEIVRLRRVACGDFHSFVVAETAAQQEHRTRIFSWGSNHYGQLGQGIDPVHANAIEEDVYANCLPVGEVVLPSNDGSLVINDIAGGAFHSAVIINYELYTFGWGLYGQLGHDNTEDLCVPTLVRALKGAGPSTDGGCTFKDCCKVSCGQWHSLVISGIGDLYGFGWNHFGQVIPDTISGATDGTPVAVQYYTPVLVPLQMSAGSSITEISCGLRHSLVVSSDGNTFIYGCLFLARQTLAVFDEDGSSIGSQAEQDDFAKIGQTRIACLSIQPNDKEKTRVIHSCHSSFMILHEKNDEGSS